MLAPKAGSSILRRLAGLFAPLVLASIGVVIVLAVSMLAGFAFSVDAGSNTDNVFIAPSITPLPPTATPKPSSTPLPIQTMLPPTKTPVPSATPLPTSTQTSTMTSTATATVTNTATSTPDITGTQAVKQATKQAFTGAALGYAENSIAVCFGFVGYGGGSVFVIWLFVVFVRWLDRTQPPRRNDVNVMARPSVAPVRQQITPDKIVVEEKITASTTRRSLLNMILPDDVQQELADELLKVNGNFGYNHWEENHWWFSRNPRDPNRNYRTVQAFLFDKHFIFRKTESKTGPIYVTQRGKTFAEAIKHGEKHIIIPLPEALAPPK